MGIAFKGFQEKTDQSKAEARRRGEVQSDDEDDKKKRNKRKKGEPVDRSAAWKEKPVVDMTFLLSKEVNIISTITLAVPREDAR